MAETRFREMLERRHGWGVVGLVALLASVTSLGGAPALAAGTARPTLTCDGAGTKVVHDVAPRNCEILYPNLSLLGGLQMQDLHWSHWGADTATAVGISHGFHSGPTYKIEVRVSGLKQSSCSKTQLWYTRLSIKSGSYGWSKPINTGYC